MSKKDPSTWSASYAKRKERTCMEVLEQLSAGMRDALSAGEYLAAAQCCNKICDGLACLREAISADTYDPMLYTHSFILAQIALFGIGGERGKQAAVPPLLDAYDCACGCAQPGRRTAEKAAEDARMIGDFIEDLKNDTPVETIKNTYCPDFPEHLL